MARMGRGVQTLGSHVPHILTLCAGRPVLP